MSDAHRHAPARDRHRPRPPPRLLPRRQRPRADADERRRGPDRPRSAARWSMTYAAFIQHAWNPDARRVPQLHELRPHLVRGHRLGGFERPHRCGRSATRVENAPDADLRDWAQRWFDDRAAALREFDIAARGRLRHARRRRGAARASPTIAPRASMLERGGDFLAPPARRARAGPTGPGSRPCSATTTRACRRR